MAYAELTLNQGTTFTSDLKIANDDGTPRNLANATFISQIRKSYYSINPTANIIITSSNTVNGEITLSVDAANTSNISPGRYLYDVKMNDGGAVIRILEGIITVTPQVSRDH